jgi:hypothetical protein
MKSWHTTPLLLVLALVLTVMAASPAVAVPTHYGTGIHLWALSCGPFPGGHSTVEYVSSAVCPNSPPPGCSCTRTTHDFPYDHPYPSRIVIGTPEPVDGGSGSGEVGVIIDVVGAIECGATVASVDGEATCGAPFNVNPADPELVGSEIIDLVESLRSEVEEQAGGPVTFSYSYANRQ